MMMFQQPFKFPYLWLPFWALLASARLKPDSDLRSQLEVTYLGKNVPTSADWVKLEVVQVFIFCLSPFMWNFRVLSPMCSMLITFLQTQHIALRLSPLNSFTQLQFGSLNHLISKRREKPNYLHGAKHVEDNPQLWNWGEDAVWLHVRLRVLYLVDISHRNRFMACY